MGNKKDLINSNNNCREEAEKLAHELSVPHIVISATKNENIDKLLTIILSEEKCKKCKKNLVNICEICSIL